MSNSRNYFLTTFAYAYIVILPYAAIAALVYFSATGPAVQALLALIFNDIIEPLLYLGAGIICYHSIPAKGKVKTGTAIALILIGVIVPALPNHIPALIGENLIFLRVFLHAHVIFSIIGGFFLLLSLKGSEEKGTM